MCRVRAFSIPRIASRALIVTDGLRLSSRTFRIFPSPSSCSDVEIYRRIGEYRKSWKTFLILELIFVSSHDFSAGIPSTLIREHHGFPSFVCFSEPAIVKHWVIMSIFRGWSSWRAASQQACPLGYFGKDKVPTSPALIGHEQVTYVCKVWPSWHSNMPHRRLTPAFSLFLSLFGLLEDWRESDELNNSLEDTLKEREKEEEEGGGREEREGRRRVVAAVSTKLPSSDIVSLLTGRWIASGDELSVCAPGYTIRVSRGARRRERMHGYKGRVIF